LRFDDNDFCAAREKLFSDGFGSFGSVANVTLWQGDTVADEQLSGLVFVDVHFLNSAGIERRFYLEINP
jgi:hypothetical protein